MKGPRWLKVALAAIGFLALGVPAAAKGVTVTISCGSVGKGYNFCKEGAEAWAKRTGNKVRVLASPKSTTDRLALYQQQLAAGSSEVDVYMIDVIWPGILGEFFVDLNQYIDPKVKTEFFPALIKANTVDGRLVGLPWFTDAGILYYRTDLLKKYGYAAPPKTWDELKAMAAKIQAGERKANPKFWGFVWQGAPYEGLTCDALEWIYSYGGGTIVDAKGNVTVNNPRAAAALKMAKSWVNTISPPGVLSYMEEEARGVWQAGNAAFMRNWPYAYALGNSPESPIKGKFDVTVLPKASTPEGRHAATLGGWQLAVSRFSKHKKEAVSLVLYLTGYNEQKRRAIYGTFLPTRPALYQDPDVLSAAPFMGRLYDVFVNAVPRPSAQTKKKYNQVSSAFWTAVHSVLEGKASAEMALAQLERQLKRIKGSGW